MSYLEGIVTSIEREYLVVHSLIGGPVSRFVCGSTRSNASW